MPSTLYLKRGFILSVFLILSFILTAQKNKSRVIAELSMGAAFPVGHFVETEYSKNNVYTEPSGFALTGFAGNALFGYYLSKSIGIKAIVGFSSNPSNNGSLTREFNRSYSVYKVTRTTDPWNVGKLMVGGFYNRILGKSSKMTFQSGISLGMSKTAIPAFTYTVETIKSGSEPEIKLPWTFCFQLDAGITYSLKGRTYLLFNAAYFKSNPEHTYLYQRYPYVQDREEKTDRYSLCSISTTVGVGVRF